MIKAVLPVKRYSIKLHTVKGVLAVLLWVVSAGMAKAQGDLLISPLRVSFEGSKKTQEINLANVGKDTATYAISIVDYRMKEDGGFEEVKVPDSGQNFAGPYLRFFPRKVTLAPNEAQVVKIQLIKTAQMDSGEYRSHLYFRAVPDERPLGEKPGKDTAGISIQLKPIFGITIPIIVRVGSYNGNVILSDVEVEMANDTPKLSFSFNRTGTMSVYGDIVVEHISKSGKTTKVKLVKGVGVYTPINRRKLKIDLDTDKKVDFHKGKLHIVYTQQMSDRSQRQAETEIELK